MHVSTQRMHQQRVKSAKAGQIRHRDTCCTNSGSSPPRRVKSAIVTLVAPIAGQVRPRAPANYTPHAPTNYTRQLNLHSDRSRCAFLSCHAHVNQSLVTKQRHARATATARPGPLARPGGHPFNCQAGQIRRWQMLAEITMPWRQNSSCRLLMWAAPQSLWMLAMG